MTNGEKGIQGKIAMLHRLRSIIGSQRGFTLIELLIVIAITALIGAVITAAIYNVWNVNSMSVSRMNAVKQVENALYWMNRDAQMAQIVQVGGGSGFPLTLMTLTWVDWGNVTNRVTYTLQDDELHRTHSVNGGMPTDTVVARHLDPSMTRCDWCDNTSYATQNATQKVLILHLTASVAKATETRESRVIPRSVL